MQGIYLIENTINGHQYVGRSVNIARRWKEHIHSSKKEDGFLLHRAIKKHGIENFKFSVLEETKDLYERECYWYYKLKPVYNMIAPDDAPSKTQRIGVKSKNKETSEIIYYESMREAARILGISKTAIHNVLNGSRNSAANCYWAYENDEFIIPIDRGNNGTRRVSVTLIKNSEVLRFDTKSEAAKFLNVNISTFRHKTAKGYQVLLNL